MAPMQSKPSRRVRYAATELSTPPLMAIRAFGMKTPPFLKINGVYQWMCRKSMDKRWVNHEKKEKSVTKM
jgi:hypothetical protein